MTKEEILDLVEEEDVEFIRLQFTDIFGELKNIAVTAKQLPKVLDRDYAFDGSPLGEGIDSPKGDLYLRPDYDTFIILPWRPQQGKVARLLCDIKFKDGTDLYMCPRTVLRRTLREAEKKGYRFYVDCECEFFLFHTDENGIPTTLTHEEAGYLDVGPLDLGENARRGIVLDLESMGFDIKASYHECAPAQHEIEFEDAEAMKAADSVVTFKNAVRSIAKRFGLHATFMPKPKSGTNGSAMHTNVSMYVNDKNIFTLDESGKPGEAACQFMAGIYRYARQMCSFTNPTVNSYKRLTTGFNHKLVVPKQRLGENVKVEVHFPDSSANPYLAIAMILSAGIRGIEEKLDIESEMDESLPQTLKEALDEARDGDFVEKVIGEKYKMYYLKGKYAEWNEYMSQISDWELAKYLYKI